MKQALIITTISGFLLKFETDNVKILQDMGYTVHYAANGNEQGYQFSENQLRESGVIFHHIDIAKSPFMVQYNNKALKQILEIIQTYKIQLIHCHTPMGGVLGRLAAVQTKQWNVKVLYTAHGFHFYQGAPLLNNTAYYAVERLLAHATDSLIVINKEDYIHAQQFQLKKGGKVYQIPGAGLNMQYFMPCNQEQKRRLRKKYNIPENAFLVLSVGELNENKNQRVILEALSEMRKTHRDIMYGICGAGFYWDRMQQWIIDYDLVGSAIMFGYCRDVREYIGMADVAVLPSRREGLGMAALEALAMGIPVVAADNRGTREYIQEGRNGFLCKWDSAKEFADCILKVKQMNVGDYAEMRKVCIASAEPFSVKNTHAIMETVYKEADQKVTNEWAK